MPPGQHFEGFFERAEATWEGNEGVRELGHQRFPVVHRFDDAQVGNARVGHLEVQQVARDHANHVAAAFEDGVGHGAHQAHVGAAVHKLDPALGDGGAQLSGSLEKARVVPRAGAGEDADAFQWATRRSTCRSHVSSPPVPMP